MKVSYLTLSRKSVALPQVSIAWLSKQRGSLVNGAATVKRELYVSIVGETTIVSDIYMVLFYWELSEFTRKHKFCKQAQE